MKASTGILDEVIRLGENSGLEENTWPAWMGFLRVVSAAPLASAAYPSPASESVSDSCPSCRPLVSSSSLSAAMASYPPVAY